MVSYMTFGLSFSYFTFSLQIPFSLRSLSDSDDSTDLRDMEDWPIPPDYKHRWLPMRGVSIDNCPMRMGLNCSGIAQWQCATIAHYSLFYNLEYRRIPPNPSLRVLLLRCCLLYLFAVMET